MWLADGDQMRAIDKRAMEEYAVPGLVLMEAASSFTARIAQEFFAPRGLVTVVTGGGNNGGDGWGAARHLAARGLPVQVITAVDPLELQGDAAAQFRMYREYGLPWEKYRGGEQFASAELIIDALLGTSVRGEPRGTAAEIIAAINASPAPVLAVDIPSGLPAGFYPPPGPTVVARATATFGLAKAGLYTPAGRQAGGKVFVDAIGLPPQLLRNTGLVLNTAAHAARALPQRRRDSHKGSYGHGLLVAGSKGMSGAAIMAGTAALRGGLGLLTIACPQQVNAVIQSSLWEALSLPLPDTEQGALSPEAVELVEPEKYRAAAIGPGCRECAGTRALADLLLQSPLPLVLDADALNVLAPGIPRRPAPTVVTPHPGEMARLLAAPVAEVVAAPLDACRRAARQWQCTVILKGASTCIADPDGNAAVNITGTDGLATGGSGDILTGLLLGLLCQGAEPFAAACAAAWLLGTASELAAGETGTASQLPRDVLAKLPQAWLRLAREAST